MFRIPPVQSYLPYQVISPWARNPNLFRRRLNFITLHSCNLCKVGVTRNRHPYVIWLVSAKSGQIWPLKKKKRFQPCFNEILGAWRGQSHLYLISLFKYLATLLQIITMSEATLQVLTRGWAQPGRVMHLLFIVSLRNNNIAWERPNPGVEISKIYQTMPKEQINTF